MHTYTTLFNAMTKKTRNVSELMLGGACRAINRGEYISIVSYTTEIGRHYPDNTSTIEDTEWTTPTTQRHRQKAGLPCPELQPLAADQKERLLAVRLKDRVVFVHPRAAQQGRLRLSTGQYATEADWARFLIWLETTPNPPAYTRWKADKAAYKAALGAARQLLADAAAYAAMGGVPGRTPEGMPHDGLPPDEYARWVAVPLGHIERALRRLTMQSATATLWERPEGRGPRAALVPIAGGRA